MNVNLGSGPKHVDGWIEYDSSLNILLSKIPPLKKFLLFLNVIQNSHAIEWDAQIKRANIIKAKFDECTISNFYLSHVLEHVFKNESQRILNNVYLGLKPGGIVRICSPDYDSIILKYQSARNQNALLAANSFEESLLSYPNERPRGIDKIRRNVGGHIHFWHPFKSQIIDQLQKSGFTDISEYNFRIGNMYGLEYVENRDEYSFYLEARK